MSNDRRYGPGTVRTVGAVSAVLGAILLSLYPYHEFYPLYGQIFGTPTGRAMYALVGLSNWLPYLWATAVIWGVAATVTGRIRSLTPARALAVPLLVPVPFAIAAYSPPTTDVVPAPPEIAQWTAPAGPLDLAVRVLAETQFLKLGAGLFLVLGIARYRNQRRWTGAIVALLLAYGALHGTATTNALHGLVFRPILAAVPGSVLFLVGRALAAESTGDTAGDVDAVRASRNERESVAD